MVSVNCADLGEEEDMNWCLGAEEVVNQRSGEAEN